MSAASPSTGIVRRITSEKADLHVAVVGQRHAGELLPQLVDGHQGAARQLPLPDLDEHVGAAGDHHGGGIGLEGADGVVHRPGRINRCNVIHVRSALLS
jgi:hypothetical protein